MFTKCSSIDFLGSSKPVFVAKIEELGRGVYSFPILDMKIGENNKNSMGPRFVDTLLEVREHLKDRVVLIQILN